LEPKAIFHLIDGKLLQLESEIEKRLDSHIDIISRIGEHIYLSKGKRIRPALLLLSARLGGYQGDEDILYGTIMEFIHTASLIHDDIVDEAAIRRGMPSINFRWGNDLTVLLGDYIYINSIDIALQQSNLKIIRILSSVTKNMIEAEIIQTTKRGDVTLSEEEYTEIIKGKTACLFSGCSQIGGVLADVSPQQEEALRAYGLNLGIAFQLIDDLLDYFASEEELGKPVGTDLKEEKVTLPLIYLLQKADKRLLKMIKGSLQGKESYTLFWKEIVQLMRDYEIKAAMQQKALHYATIAKHCLTSFDNTPARQAMERLADFVVYRDR